MESKVTVVNQRQTKEETLYHGTSTEFTKFNKVYLGKGVGGLLEGPGVYLTDKLWAAEYFARDAAVGAGMPGTGVVLQAKLRPRLKILDIDRDRIDPAVGRSLLQKAGLRPDTIAYTSDKDLSNPKIIADFARYGKNAEFTRRGLMMMFKDLGYDGVRFDEMGSEEFRLAPVKARTTLIFNPSNVEFEGGMRNIPVELYDLSKKTLVGVFGSILEKPFKEAKDVDLVIVDPQKYYTLLRNISKKYNKILDIFIPSETERGRKILADRTSKVMIYPTGEIKKDEVFTPSGFFEGLIILTPSAEVGESVVKEAPAPKRVFKREGKLEINPLLLQAFGITPEDIAETIKQAEEPEAMRDMFAFLSDYATLSDLGTRLSVSGDKLDFMVADLRRRMPVIIDFYEYHAKTSGDIDEERALLKIAERAKELSKPVGGTRLDKILYIEAVADFEHTSGSIIPLLFGISDFGREDYWPKKLLAFLRTHGMPGMVREGSAPENPSKLSKLNLNISKLSGLNLKVRTNKDIERNIGRRLTVQETGVLNRLRELVRKQKLETTHLVAGRTDSEILQQQNGELYLRSRGIEPYET